ncbi:MAG: fasciclin domain-containing protein [Bacteroidota bacterium]
MKFNKLGILASILILFLAGCEDKWAEHYETIPETVDRDLWEVIKEKPELSMFVEYMEEFNYDTLFDFNDTYTLFVPTNTAFDAYSDTASVTRSVLDYHISKHFVQSGNIEGKRKVQTLAEKFALLDKGANGLTFDLQPVEMESPLYQNGKFFVLSNVAHPRPNIFEYFRANNRILADYVEELDSIILDLERSIPIGFTEDGRTIYDTVAEIYNEFEEEFFPIREEFRNLFATVVFPDEEDYNAGLNSMVEEMAGVYQDYTDVPMDWQNDILIPYLLERGVFPGMIEPITFETPTYGDTVKVLNVLGDSVIIDYEIGERTLASNGYIYNYQDFNVPDTLYNGSIRFEGEHLLRPLGEGGSRFVWNEEEGVKVQIDVAQRPLREFNKHASNDSIMKINFINDYTGKFTVEFLVDNLFPRDYRMLVRTHMNIGGIYNIYVNDVLTHTFDYYDYIRNGGYLPSVTGRRFRPENGFSYFDFYMTSTTDYGQTRIKFEYVEPGQVLSQGFVVDYFEFFPM